MNRANLSRYAASSMGWGTHLLVAGSSLFFLLWLVPYYDGLPGATDQLDPPNEKTRVLGVASVGLFGDLHINKARKKWWTREIDLAGRKRRPSDPPGTPDRLLFPAKTPGMHIALGVMYRGYRRWIAQGPATLWEVTYFSRLFGGILPVWLSCLLFYLLLLHLCRSRYIILSGFYVFLLGNMTYPYALTVSSHSLSNSLLLAAFAALWWCPRSIGWRIVSAVVAGVSIGCAFGTEYTSLFTSIWLGVFALMVQPATPARYMAAPLPQGWRAGVLWVWSRWHLAIALVSSLIPVAVVLWSHKVLFGQALKTPYNFMLNDGFRESFAKVNFLIFTLPPQWEQSAGSLFSPSYGLFFWTPLLAFAGVGLHRLWRERRWGLLGLSVTFLLFWASYASLQYNPRGGWSVGPRYIANIVPFAMLLALWGADRLYQLYGNRIVPLFAATGIWSILHYSLTSVQFPHLPDKFIWPQIEVVYAMLQRGLVPSSITSLPASVYMPIYLLAVAGVCAYLLCAGFRGRRRWLGIVVTGLLVGFALFAMMQLPTFDYAEREHLMHTIEGYIPSDVRWH